MTRKYKLNLKRTLFIGLVAAVGFSGCKKFLDVNQNPNNPEVVDPSLLLPTTQAALSQVVGNSLQVFGNMYAQYWTQNPQSSQYKTIDQYLSKNSDFDNAWLNLYRVALVNSDLILKSSQQLQYTKGIAYLMKAYGFQLATDAFGDVPLTQALQGSNANPNPKYDAQQAVYDSIFVYINKAMPLLTAKGATSPGGQDMIFQGDMDQWVAFANTLKLRAYLRLSKAEPTIAEDSIKALYKTTPAFLTVDASIQYTSTGGNENPFYNEATSPTLAGFQNVVASSTAVDAFTANSDPRLPLLYDLLTPGASSLVSIPQGGFADYVGKSVSPPSAITGGNASDPASATAPVKLLSAAESYFLQAEAVARGWGTGDVTDLYTKGVTASFTATGAGDPTTYLTTAPAGLAALTGTIDNKVKAIITQKYFAMCGFQGFEAWTEWRRTGYPTFLVTSAGAPSPTSPLPQRLLYPNSEQVTNANFPGSVPYSTPVWWAK